MAQGGAALAVAQAALVLRRAGARVQHRGLFHPAVQGALDAIPAGEVEACRALGFSASQTLWMKTRHAARRLVPAYSNEVILVLKGSSLASTITIMDIMGLAQRLNAQTYDTLAVFTVAGGLYLTMNGLLTIGFRWCEKRALAFQS